MPNTVRDASRLFTLGSAAALLVAAVYLGLQSRWVATTVLSIFFVLTWFLIIWPSRLPRLFEALFAAAALLNAAGFIADLYSKSAAFDEIAHFYTSFAVTLVFGFIVYESLLHEFVTHRLLLVLSITCIGISIGVGWEIMEWFAELVSGRNIMLGIHDTITDLLFDGLGAFLAALLNARAFANAANQKYGSGYLT